VSAGHATTPEPAGVPAAPGTQQVAAAAEVVLLLFGVSTEVYALRIEQTAEVMSLPPYTLVPRMPAHLLGVCFRHGRLLPIVDLGRKLGLRQGFRPGPLHERRSGRPAVLVARTRLGELGLLIDRVLRVAKVPATALQPAGVQSPCTLAAIATASFQAHLLDLEAVGPGEG
jgi:purine-binding chemotaxis protein CheW